MPKILVVDDEPDALEVLGFNLKNAGYEVTTADDGDAALKKARQQLPDLILLDLMLPEVDGLEVCKLLRRDPATSAIPIIMVTAKAGEIDRVVGLELILRIRNLLKRRSETEEEKPQTMQFGDLLIDIPRHLVSVAGQRIDLTATEFKLLIVLAQRRGRVQSREALLRDVWEYDNLIDTRTVDTHMRRLREKLGEGAQYLDTVRGVGYRFMEA
jgi:two-component system phosphate regulon response regulator PhoB